MATGPVSESWGVTRINVIKFSYKWTINNFSFCGEKTGDMLLSPTFSSDANDNFKWCLKLYPKGENEECKEYLALYLYLVSCNKAEVRAKMQFSILKRKVNKKIRNTFNCFSQGSGWGYRKYIHLDDLNDKAYAFLVDDTLILCCEIRAADDSFTLSGQNNSQLFKIPECSHPNAMEQLFESQRFSDFTLSVNNREFCVHKCILASYSPVFAAMFELEMEEKKDNRAEIKNMDAEVMEEMLRFVYTGKAPCKSKMDFALLAAADKYALERLKVMCEEALYASLSVKTASDTLVLADVHSADQLKTQIINFIVLRAAEVMETCCWKTMVVHHPHLVEEVLQAVTSEGTLLHHGPPRKRPKLA